MRTKIAARTVLVLVSLLGMGGCSNWNDWKTDKSRFFAPDELVNKEDIHTPINPILTTTGVADTTQELPPNSTFPTEGDWEYLERDYILGPTDVLSINVMDLYQEGLETVLQRQVSDTGYVDLPLLPPPGNVKAEGLTKDEFTAAVKRAYQDADVLKEPVVSVTLLSQRQNTFSVLGAVSRPGSYNVLRRDMRLLEALAVAGGLSQTNIRYVYVIRPSPAVRKQAEGAALPPITRTPTSVPAAQTKPTTTAPGSGDLESILQQLQEAMPGSNTSRPSPSVMPRLTDMARTAATSRTATTSSDEELTSGSPGKFIYVAGRGYVRVGQDAPQAGPGGSEVAAEAGAAGKPTGTTRPKHKESDQTDPYGWKKVNRADTARIIAINLAKLQDGDPRMNIVIRDNDIVRVPALEMGEFYVMGEVQRPGPYSLTGRRVTIKMAIAAAGNPTPLSWPENSILIRRLGDNQEQMIPVNIEAIFRGDEADYFLKPDDVIAVGSDIKSTFYAVFRNAFRLTYGFGFIYDRNFSDPMLYPGKVDSERFKRW